MSEVRRIIDSVGSSDIVKDIVKTIMQGTSLFTAAITVDSCASLLHSCRSLCAAAATITSPYSELMVALTIEDHFVLAQNRPCTQAPGGTSHYPPD